MTGAKQTSATKSRTRAVGETKEQPLAEPEEQRRAPVRRKTTEFTMEPQDQQLLDDLQAHLASLYGEQRPRTRILRASSHHGLLVEIIVAGPDKRGLYAGRYTGRELAEMTRQQALLLSDVQARYSTPIFQGTPAWQVTPPGASSPNGGVPSPGAEAEIDKIGAAALKGLVPGLMKRKTPGLPPPD